METTKMCDCGRRFKVQDWKKGVEREKCNTCIRSAAFAVLSARGAAGLLVDISNEFCDDCKIKLLEHAKKLVKMADKMEVENARS